jgi:quercetin dioxygenase-like cupin family protein
MIQYLAMQSYNWNLVEEEPLNPLLGRKTIHGQNLTVARIRLRKGAVVPMHSHPNEQISMLESGAVRFTISGESRVVRAGEALVIPPDVPHYGGSARRLAGCGPFFSAAGGLDSRRRRVSAGCV